MKDGHVRVLPLHVANKIAAGEVVERPASVVKELIENAIDAGAKHIRVSITQGGRKLVSIQDDGCGMTRDDAVLSLERQATSKISDVDDIENIDTLGFRGEAIPSIASVSRFTLTTRRHDSDEGTFLQVNAGTLAEVRAAGCPPGTLVEVRDLFCNVPARRKFLRSYATEESHIRDIFTVHALAHPSIAFTLVIDGRETHRLAAAPNINDRVHDLFGEEFLEAMRPLPPPLSDSVRFRVSGFIEKPNLFTPTRRDQYVFVNGRPATAPSISYALREAYPRRNGDIRPSVILFLDLPPSEVDVNVHPTKREVRFRNNAEVKSAVIGAIQKALLGSASPISHSILEPTPIEPIKKAPQAPERIQVLPTPVATPEEIPILTVKSETPPIAKAVEPEPVQTEISLSVSSDGRHSKPWKWFAFLAQTSTGYLLIETDEGLVTIHPLAARERLAYERLIPRAGTTPVPVESQTLLLPEIVRLSSADFARINSALPVVRAMGFQLEEFGSNVFKVDALPTIIGSQSPTAVLTTIAQDFAEPGAKRGDRWREELIARSVAKAYAGAETKMTRESAEKLVNDLSSARMPYVTPRGKPIMNFVSNRELARKFDRV